MGLSLSTLFLFGCGFLCGLLVGRLSGGRGRDRDSLDFDLARQRRMAHHEMTPGELDARVRDLIGQRRKIDAIKLVREATGTGLKHAKDYVERL